MQTLADLNHLQALYEMYKLQIEDVKKDVIIARGMLNQAIENGYTDITEPLRLKLILSEARLDFLESTCAMLLGKLKVENSFSYAKFDKIDLDIHLGNN